MLLLVVLFGPTYQDIAHGAAAAAARSSTADARWSSPPVDDVELKKMIRGVLGSSSSEHQATVPVGSKGATQLDKQAVLEALAESMGYGRGNGAVDHLRTTLGAIDEDMASLPPEILADSFARTIAGAISLGLAVATNDNDDVGDDVIVHAVGTAEGREGVALEHMTGYLSEVDFGVVSRTKKVRIVMIGPEWSESNHKQTTVLETDSKEIGAASIMTYRGLYDAATLRDLAMPAPTAVICFNCDIYHCHWRASLLFMLAQAR